MEHRAPRRAEPHRRVQRLAGGARQPLARRSHRLDRAPRAADGAARRSRARRRLRARAPQLQAARRRDRAAAARRCAVGCARSHRRAGTEPLRPSHRIAASAARRGPDHRTCRPAERQRARSACDQQPARRPRGRAPALQRGARAAQRQVVAIMRDNSVKLQRLIEELLDYQRALHAAASLEVKPLMLDQLVAEATKAHHLAAQAKGLRLLVDAQPAMLEADPEKLRSIVDNLISNAVKFTPPGGVISVKARALGGEAVIEVMDSGPGVAPEERESIFNLFFRGRTKADTGVKGSGLGLAIARELVEAHGGQIAVVAGGAGGHFRVTLPRRGERRAYS